VGEEHSDVSVTKLAKLHDVSVCILNATTTARSSPCLWIRGTYGQVSLRIYVLSCNQLFDGFALVIP
jgi:hypothetical protein